MLISAYLNYKNKEVKMNKLFKKLEVVFMAISFAEEGEYKYAEKMIEETFNTEGLPVKPQCNIAVETVVAH